MASQDWKGLTHLHDEKKQASKSNVAELLKHTKRNLR